MIRISLLGTFEVVHHDKIVAENDWHTRQARQLLKILITERPRPVANDRLMEILWPTSVPKAASTTLRSAINALRNVLEPDRASRARSKYIHTESPGYAFREHPDIWLDVAQFEQNLSEADALSAAEDAVQDADFNLQRTLLIDALALYRDDYLSSDPYADWAHNERERLRELYFNATLQLASLEAQLGDYANAIALTRRILTRDNIREKAYQSLMRYQAESGDSAGALLTYDRCRTVLLEELGADPSPSTQALHQQILSGEIKSTAVPTSQPQPATSTYIDSATVNVPVPPLPQLVQMPVLDEERIDIFVGRTAETDNFSAKLNHALDGHGTLLAILGEAGIGKTRFAYNLLQLATKRGENQAGEKTATILSTACHALEQTLPFAPIIDLLNRYLQNVPVEALGNFSQSNLAQLIRILPTLRDKVPALSLPLTGDIVDYDNNRRQLIDGIVAIFTELARFRPLVLFVDDLHWADAETIFVLSRLSHQIVDLPLCLVVAYREGDATSNSALLQLQHAEHRLHPTHFLTLERLRLEHIQSIVQQYFLQKFSGGKKTKEKSGSIRERGLALAKLLYNTTRGNALFVTESIKALDELDDDQLASERLENDTPDQQNRDITEFERIQQDNSEIGFGHLLSLRRNQRVQELIIERIERLPEKAIEILQIAAVIGRDFHTDLLEAIVALDPAAVDPLDGIERLLERKFLLERPDDRLDFTHGVIRQVAYDSMSTLHRRRLHQRVGDAMVQLQLAESAPSEVAFQYANAGRNARLPYARYSVLAGRKLLATYGQRQAIDYFDDALFVLDAIPESDPTYDPKLMQQALIGRGLAAESLLEPEHMIDTYRQQQRWAHKQNNRTFLITAQGRLILMLALTGQQRESNELLQELIRFIVNEPDSTESQLNDSQASNSQPQKQKSESPENAEGKSDDSPALEDSPVLVDLITRRHLIYSPSLPTAEKDGVRDREVDASDRWTAYTHPQPAIDGAAEHLLQILPPIQAVLPLFDYGWILRIQGQLGASESCLKAVIELAAETSQNFASQKFIASVAYHQLAVAMRMRGDLQKSHELNEQSIALNDQLQGAPAELASLWPRIGSAFLDLRMSDITSSKDGQKRAQKRAQQQVDRAERRLNRVVNFLTKRNSFRSHLNSAHIGLGEVALSRGEYESARELFDMALSDSLNLHPYTTVRAWLGQARIAHKDGDRNRSAKLLQQALHFAGTRSLIEEYAETVAEIAWLTPADAPVEQLVNSTKKQLKSMGLNEVHTILEQY